MSRTILLRTMSLPTCTIGVLRFEDIQVFTLELPWLNNQQDKSCIHSGMFTWFKRTSPKNGAVIQLENVPGRTYVQIHAGNYVSQTAGCILVGDMIKDINHDNVPDVGNSKNTLQKLLDATPDTGNIVIERGFADKS